MQSLLALPLLPAPRLRPCGRRACGLVGGGQRRLAVSLLLADAGAPGRRPCVQGPWPGHKGGGLSVFDQGLEGRRPGLGLPAPALWDLRAERPAKPPGAPPAPAGGPQHRLLGPGAGALLRAPPRGRTGAPPALRRRGLQGARAAALPGGLSTPRPQLRARLPGAAGRVRPREGFGRRPGRRAPPRLGEHPPGPGCRPDRCLGGGSRVDAARGQSRPGPRVRAALPEGWPRGLGRAQVAAHGSRQQRGAIREGLPAVPDVSGRAWSGLGSGDRWRPAAKRGAAGAGTLPSWSAPGAGVGLGDASGHQAPAGGTVQLWREALGACFS